VGHQHQGRAGFGVEGEHQLDDRLAGGHVEVAGRLVGQHQRRPRREGPGHRDPLLLAPDSWRG
jgi:hypothetical protein